MATIKERIDGVTDDVTQGKQNISSAITEKGVETSSSATFSVMADNIRAIESGAKDRINNSGETVFVIAGESGVTIGYSGNTASGEKSVAEGRWTTANGVSSHAEGDSTTASGISSHAEGTSTKAYGDFSHTEGGNTKAYGKYSHAEGQYTVANGLSSHVEGNYTQADGEGSHCEGNNTKAIGVASHVEGNRTNAIGKYSHAEGYSDNSVPSTITSTSSYDDIYDTWFASKFSLAFGQASHVEGTNCFAYGQSSHTEGNGNYTIGIASHAEGNQTEANGANSHAEGLGCVAIGANAHAEGYYTQTFNTGEHACGKWNKSTSGTTSSTGATLFSVGLGSYNGDRNNAIEITQTGILKSKTAWQVGSDRKLKDNITPLENNTLEKVLQLNPVRFTLKDDVEKKEKIGFIAQEVETVFPEYVTVSVDNEGEETRYLDYSQMVSVLCKAIQEQQKEIEELKKLININ